MNNSPFYVYAFFRVDGTPCYIGKGKGVRMGQNGKSGRSTYLRNILLSEDVERVKLIDGLTEDEALSMERFFIAAIGRKVDGTGPLVNISSGGDAGFRGGRHTDEAKEKMRVAQKGRPKTPEHIKAAAEAQRGKKRSSGWWSTEEGRAKQRQNNRGNSGKRHSPEALAKIRSARALQRNVSGKFPIGNVPWNAGSSRIATLN